MRKADPHRFCIYFAKILASKPGVVSTEEGRGKRIATSFEAILVYIANPRLAKLHTESLSQNQSTRNKSKVLASSCAMQACTCLVFYQL